MGGVWIFSGTTHYEYEIKYHFLLQTQCQLLKRWKELSTGLLTIYFITEFFSLILIHWIVSNPMDSPIHVLSNRGQQIRRNI